MKIEITSKRVKPFKKATEVYKLHIGYIDTDDKSVTEFRTLEGVTNDTRLVAHYMKLLDEAHNTWCNIEPCMITEAAAMIDLDFDEEDSFDFFLQCPAYPDYMSRPDSYKVTYVDSDGIEYKCNITN